MKTTNTTAATSFDEDERQTLLPTPSPNRGSLPWWERFELAFPPNKLYRVHHDTAGTTYSNENGFESPSQVHPEELSDDDFWHATRLHLTWTEDSRMWKNAWRILISAYSKKQRALEWIRSYRDQCPNDKFYITTIDTSVLKKLETPVYDAPTMIRDMDIRLKPWLHDMDFEGEYLVLHHISADAIVKQELIPQENASNSHVRDVRDDTPEAEEDLEDADEFMTMVPPGHPLYMKTIHRSQLEAVKQAF